MVDCAQAQAQAQALSHAMELLHAAWWLWSLEKLSHPLNTILEK
jgi:hypothetical protein